ncbi:MAG: peptidoglycan-binding protein [Sedimentibacter sp.]|uniref:peptidoglycan-binding protein n=1 Tax=Sedimentibacter sp. TaxID=1960295 RepID=UPI00315979E6
MSIPETIIHIPGAALPHIIVPFPLTITVHLGAPDEEALNVTVPYIDYIKNVASSELYPTWPEEALRANIHAITSIAMSRIFTEWYRGRGYDFDITNDTRYDQAYVHERGFFDTVANISNEIFDQYVVREGHIEPLFTTFCDGRISQCNGMYQWGSVDLANQGYTPLEILRYYYGNDVTIVPFSAAGEVVGTYPGTPLALGESGIPVFRMQHSLNRISRSYPAIPVVNISGYFDETTQAAVRAFQQVFNLPVTGVVDSVTWYRIRRIYVAVTRLAELTSEGLLISDLIDLYSHVLLEGDTRPVVVLLQYYLNLLAENGFLLPEVTITGNYGPETTDAVTAYQNLKGLPPAGIVNGETWNSLYRDVYLILVNTPVQDIYLPSISHMGVIYTEGMGSEHPGILILQIMLTFISQNVPEIPPPERNGTFGPATRKSVTAFQNIYELEPTGIVNAVTWNRINEVYQSLRYQ